MKLLCPSNDLPLELSFVHLDCRLNEQDWGGPTRSHDNASTDKFVAHCVHIVFNSPSEMSPSESRALDALQDKSLTWYHNASYSLT
jgi:hypothetical protein